MTPTPHPPTPDPPPVLDYSTPPRPLHGGPPFTAGIVLRGVVVTAFILLLFVPPVGLLILCGGGRVSAAVSDAVLNPPAFTAGMILLGIILGTIGVFLTACIAAFVWRQWRDREW